MTKRDKIIIIGGTVIFGSIFAYLSTFIVFVTTISPILGLIAIGWILIMEKPKKALDKAGFIAFGLFLITWIIYTNKW